MTEYQNSPSAVRSRAIMRAQRGSSATEAGVAAYFVSSVVVMSVRLVIYGPAMMSNERAIGTPALAFKSKWLRTADAWASATRFLRHANGLHRSRTRARTH